MGSDTPLLDVLDDHFPLAVGLSTQSRTAVETLLAFALGADCPTRLQDTRLEWSRTQPGALRALQDAIGHRAAKRARDSQDTDDSTAKRQKTVSVEDDVDDPPRFTLPSISTTSPVRKKVDVSVHARSIRFLNPTTRALEASVPLASVTRAFLLPTRGKTKGHWTVLLLTSDVPDKAKASPPTAQQIIFGLDALSPTPFEITSYPSGTSTPTSTATIAKGEQTVSALRAFLSHIPVPLLEPSSTVFRSACATPKAGHGAAGIDAYLGAKSGTLWFFDEGILWGESKPCEFWAVADLIPKDAVRLISATGRTCSVILSRRNAGEGEDGIEDAVVETAFSMVDGREQDPIDAWARHRKHLFGKNGVRVAAASGPSSQVAGSSKEARPTQPVANGTVKGPAWDDSDPDDDDFEVASSEDLEHSSADEDENSEGEGGVGSGDENGSQNSDGGESGEELEEEELDEAHHPLLRPGAMPRMSKAAIDTVVDMVHRDLVDDVSEEEDELEE